MITEENPKSTFITPFNSLEAPDIEALVALLNEDKLLRCALGMQDSPLISTVEFNRITQQWQADHHAFTYAIFFQTTIIGMISVSHMTTDGLARIGYWLTSTHWNRGIATKAFALALEKAKSLGIHEVSAIIEKDNIASLKIWGRLGAHKEQLDIDRMKCTIFL